MTVKKLKPGKHPFEKREQGLNTATSRILEHIEANMRLPLPQLRACPPRAGKRAVLACGGPSLKMDFPKLRALVDDGAILCTVNNVHNFCLGEGIIPDVQVMLDARPFNRRFVIPAQEETLYCLASQCHPQTFEAVKGHRVCIYHCDTGNGEAEILNAYYHNRVAFVEGGCTVALRALRILQILGFTNIDVFGFDSCLVDDEHHAYEQTENDNAPFEEVVVDGRTFRCHTWMTDQAVDFMSLMKARAVCYDNIEVHGDGLIAALMRSAVAKFERKESNAGHPGNTNAA